MREWSLWKRQKTRRNDSPEIREPAVRMVLEHEADYKVRWTAIGSIASQFGCHSKTLGLWLHQSEQDQGLRTGETLENERGLRL